LNPAKAHFFDSEVESDWSSKEYDQDELIKIERILEAGSIREGSRVVEPGCGTGRLTLIIAERIGPSGLVVANDISPMMVENAEKRLRGSSNVRLTWGTIEEAKLEHASFDTVICHNVFPHFDDKAKAVLKLRSALKPSGVFVVSHFMNSAGINDLHRKTNPAVASDFLPPADEMRKIFESAGMNVEFVHDDENGYLLKAIA
jgi:demethylmenaquinone methyltransferase/2-methoxy-6-polyprenyl-1,4-benzoquinol methylase